MAIKDLTGRPDDFLEIVAPAAARGGKAEAVRALPSAARRSTYPGCYHRETTIELTPLGIARVRKRKKVCEVLRELGARDDVYTVHGRSEAPLDLGAAGRRLGRLERRPGARRAPVRARRAARRGRRCRLGRPARAARGRARAWPRPGRELAGELGFPPLVDACRGNHNAPDDPDRPLRYLELGADVNARDKKGKTALQRAAQAGFLKITELLLERGAHVEHENRLGQTALVLAKRSKKKRADEVRECLARACTEK